MVDRVQMAYGNGVWSADGGCRRWMQTVDDGVGCESMQPVPACKTSRKEGWTCMNVLL